MPARRSARRSGTGWPRESASSRAPSTTRRRFQRLAETLEKLDAERGTGGNHAFYLSIPPKAFQTVCEQLPKSGLARPQEGRWSRVVIEKPFGHDLAERAGAQRHRQQRLPRGVGVPHRPLPRQGDRAEHPGAAVRQPAVRADLERTTTSTACRSPWPRTSASAAAAATTTASARRATSSRTT